MFKVNELLEGFIPSLMQKFLPTRLIVLQTMRVIPILSSEGITLVGNTIHGIVKARIEEWINRDLTSGFRDADNQEYVYCSNFVEKIFEDTAWYAVLSHRWGRSEVVTFGDVHRIHTVTPDAISAMETFIRADPNYLNQRSLLSELGSEVISGRNKYGRDDSALFALSRLLNGVEPLNAGVDINSGLRKLVKFCRVALQEYGCKFAWMDTCCIDKSSSAELDESIRSMFRWYRNSHICIVHLASTSKDSQAAGMAYDPWFSRGWTLQELIAPRAIKFYDSHWNPFTSTSQKNDKILTSAMPEAYTKSLSTCDGDSFIKTVASITRVSLFDMLNFEPGLINIRERLKWAARRETTRVEDQAYSLLGIFNITIPIAYGEGENAMYRLQAAIMEFSNDRSIFLWDGDASFRSSMLSGTLLGFSGDYDVIEEDVQFMDLPLKLEQNLVPPPHFNLTNHGLAISLSLYDASYTMEWLRDSDHKFDHIIQTLLKDIDRRTTLQGRTSPGTIDTYRLAALGYARWEGLLFPIFMILTEHKIHGNTYFRRYPWCPRVTPFISFEDPPNPTVVYIR